MFVDRPWHRLEQGRALNASEELRKRRKVHLLPATAREFYQEEILLGEMASAGWNPVMRTVLAGTRSGSSPTPSPLSLLLEHEETLVCKIMSMITYRYIDHIRLTIPAPLVGRVGSDMRILFTHGRNRDFWNRRELIEGVPTVSAGHQDGFVAFSRCGQVEFPTPNNRGVNMLPFILGEISSLPANLQCYYAMIDACPFNREEGAELGKVAYLTVQENYVDANQSQRRGGLHIESPGVFSDDPRASSFAPAMEHPWGMGMFVESDKYEGGIYFASNQSDTTEVWDALVDRSVPGIVDKGGGCEHLRNWIGEGTKLEANELIWMTDRTPHEALPQKSSGHRQFFRLVMPCISHWYADHSTPNPNVHLPDDIKVIHGNKFERHGMALPWDLSSHRSPTNGEGKKTTQWKQTYGCCPM